jgi:hypothetical protein
VFRYRPKFGGPHAKATRFVMYARQVSVGVPTRDEYAPFDPDHDFDAADPPMALRADGLPPYRIALIEDDEDWS